MDSSLKHRFGALVAAHRKKAGITQAQLAEAAELSTDMIARIESGTSGARFQTVEKIANALKVDCAELFTPHIPKSSLGRPVLTAIMVRLAKETDADLEWLKGILEGLLSKRN